MANAPTQLGKENIFKTRNGSQERKILVPEDKKPEILRLVKEENDKFIGRKIANLLGVHPTTGRKIAKEYQEKEFNFSNVINNLLMRPWV